MRRRQFVAALTVAGVGGLAGCSDPAGSIRLTDVSDDAVLADRYAQRADELPDRYRRLVAGAVAGDGERATVASTAPPFEPRRPLRYDGRYYAVSYSAENEREETQYAIEATVDPDPPPERTVAFADLPEVDREKLDDLLDPDSELPGDEETIGVVTVYTDAEEEASVVVPTPEYDGVTRDGRTFGVAVPDSEEVTVFDYRYRAELLAESAAELAALARERYRFRFDSLPDAQRSILDDAKNDEVRSEDPPSQAFADLVERFKAHDGIEVTDDGGTWLLRYDGDDWWAEVRYPLSTPAAE